MKRKPSPSPEESKTSAPQPRTRKRAVPAVGTGVRPRASEYKGIIDLIRSMDDIQRRAAQQYEPVVDDILRSRSRDVAHIEHTLDHLLDFCGYEPVLAMYKQLCRHLLYIDPAATAYYINAYREYWDSDDQEGEP